VEGEVKDGAYACGRIGRPRIWIIPGFSPNLRIRDLIPRVSRWMEAPVPKNDEGTVLRLGGAGERSLGKGQTAERYLLVNERGRHGWADGA
jgi:hypothetical protein